MGTAWRENSVTEATKEVRNWIEVVRLSVEQQIPQIEDALSDSQAPASSGAPSRSAVAMLSVRRIEEKLEELNAAGADLRTSVSSTHD
jgi:hypothetical protein